MAQANFLCVQRETSELALPVQKASRLQFNCLSVSKEYIVFGANAGSIYVFDRKSLNLIKFIGNKVTAVHKVLFSPDGKSLAICYSGGIVACFEVDKEQCLFKPARELVDHRGSEITSICWDENSARLFIGDSRGRVTSNIVFPFKLSAGKFLSKSTSESILKEERPIVQLDFCKERLLVSTLTRTLLCLTERSQFLQIGSKPRDGQYGSTFLHMKDSDNPVIYCARPGSRLWEVDANGQVIATHQFKASLAKPSLEVLGLSSFLPSAKKTWNQPHSVNFPKLVSFKNRFIVTWSQYGLYITDPAYGKAADWYSQIQDIVDICCDDATIYVLHTNGHTTELVYCELKEILTELNSLELHDQFVKISLENKSCILDNPENFIAFDFHDILNTIQGLDGIGDEIVTDFKLLIEELEERHNEVKRQILERMNSAPDAWFTPSDSGVEDNDDVRSVGAASETSSGRLSLSRIAEIDVDNVVQKARSALVNRIVKSGFIQRALKEALEAEGREEAMKATTAEGSGRAKNSQGDRGILLIPRGSHSKADDDSDYAVGNSPAKLNRMRRRRKPKTVEFGKTSDTGKARPLARRCNSLGVLDTVQGEAHVKTPHSSPPSPSLRNIATPTTGEVHDAMYSRYTDMSPEAKTFSPVGSNASSDSSIDRGSQNQQRVLYRPKMDALHLITELVEITALSRNRLRDTRFLFNPTSVRSILQDWVGKFEETVQKYVDICITGCPMGQYFPNLTQTNREAFQMLVREDFFRRLGVAFSEISNMAMLCFESGIFPTSCCTLSDLERKLLGRTLSLEDCRVIAVRLSHVFDGRIRGDVQCHLKTPSEYYVRSGQTNDVSQPSSLETGDSVVKESEVNYQEEGLVDTVKRDVNKAACAVDNRILADQGTHDLLKPQPETKCNQNDIGDYANYSVDPVDDCKGRDSSVNRAISNNQFERRLVDPANSKLDVSSRNKSVLSDKNETEYIENRSKKTLADDKEVPEFDRKLDESRSRSVNEFTVYTEQADGNKRSNTLDDLKNNADSFEVTPNGGDGMVQLQSRMKLSNNTSDKVETCTSSLNMLTDSKTSSCDTIDNHVGKDSSQSDALNVNDLCLNGGKEGCVGCAEDVCYACFVIRNYPLLDSKKIRKILNWSRNCRWRTWMAYFIWNEGSSESGILVNAIQNEDWGKVSRMLLEASTPDLLTAVLQRLYKTQPDLVKDCFRGNMLYPWEVHFMTILLLTETAYNGEILSILNHRSSESSYQDKQVIPPLVKAFLRKANLETQAKCSCGKARPGRHLLGFRDEAELEKLIGAVLTSYGTSTELLRRIGDLCQERGYWKGAAKLFSKVQDNKRVLNFSAQLHDSTFLDTLIDEGILHLNAAEWMYAIKLTFSDKTHVVNSSQHHCQPMVPSFQSSWTTQDLIWIMMRRNGPDTCFDILRRLSYPLMDISDQFFFVCLQNTALQERKRKIISRVREILSADAQGRDQLYMTPSLESLKGRELHGPTSKDLEDFEDFEDSLDGLLDREVADGLDQGHWGIGITLSMSTCQVCTLPLTTQAGFSSAGIIIFKCGHCFHRKCVPEECCLSCFIANFSSVAS